MEINDLVFINWNFIENPALNEKPYRIRDKVDQTILLEGHDYIFHENELLTMEQAIQELLKQKHKMDCRISDILGWRYIEENKCTKE